MMEPEELERLKHEHGFDAWGGRTTLEENLFIWRFFLVGDEFPDWKAHRLRPIETETGPSVIQSFWRPKETDGDVFLRMDVYESESRIAAHEFLLHHLGTFQSPMLTRDDKEPVGDVSFATSERYCVVLSRANVVIVLRNAGKDLIPVSGVAQDLDRHLVQRPAVDTEKVAPRIDDFAFADREPKPGVSMPLRLDAADPLERPLMYKFYSSSGEVLLEENRLVYRAASTGPQEITVFAVNENRGAASLILRAGAK